MVETFLSYAIADLAPWTAALLFAASFAGSFMTVALGVGGGAFLLAVMATLVPPAALIPLHGVVQLGSNVFRAALFWRSTYWPAVSGFAAGSAVGASVGGVIAVDLPPAAVQIGVGAFILWSVLGRVPSWLSRWSWLVGGLSSFLTMFFGATGGFIAVYVKALALPRADHVATHAVLTTLQHLLKTLVFGVLGFAFGPWLGFLAVMIGLGFLGTLAGRLVLLRIDDRLFQRILSLMLAIIALRLIWQGVAGYLGAG